MKKAKQVLVFSLAFALLVCFSLPAEASSVYKYTPDDTQWSLLSLDERKDSTRISSSKVSSMSDQELIKAIEEYPFLIDIYAFDNISMGIEHLQDECDAYKELLSRDTGALSLSEAITKGTGISSESSILKEELSALLLYQPAFASKANICDFKSIEKLSNVTKTFGTPLYRSSMVTTPNGTIVPVLTPGCSHTAGEHDAMDADIMNSYPNISRISRGTCKYNCHSYAWYSQSTSNTYWINTPVAYMSDGSYSKVMSGINSSSITASYGDRVFWGTNSSPIHSAILHSSSSGVPLATRIVYSKWGPLGVFKHQVSVSPYNTNSISVWHR